MYRWIVGRLARRLIGQVVSGRPETALKMAAPDLRFMFPGDSSFAADYREAGDTLRITVSTDETVGSTDWFDLGVTITVAGRPVPFLDVFLALSRYGAIQTGTASPAASERQR